MGRNKITRECRFKPEYKTFKPEKISGVVELNSDEIEALFLLDFQDLYQEEAAKLMNISRPTLSRIIKSARKKVSSAIVLGLELQIVDKKDDFNIAFSVDKEDDFSLISSFKRLIVIVKIKNCKIIEINYISNPISKPNIKPSQILPNLLIEKRVNYWITDKIGEGLKGSLLTHGIFIKIKGGFRNKDEIIELFKNTNNQ